MHVATLRATLALAPVMACLIAADALAGARNRPPEVDLDGMPPCAAGALARADLAAALAADPAAAMRDPGESFLYVPGFDPATWSGSLKRFRLTAAADGTVRVAERADWDAGAILTGQHASPPQPRPEARRMFAGRRLPSGGLAASPFTWEALDAVQRELLDRPPARDPAERAPADGLGPRRLAWLRGHRGDEAGQAQGQLRRRDRVLGDIVNSLPVHAGPPALRTGGPGYAEFRARHRQRHPVVYVGANDGMLHAFDAGSGIELFAYLPAALLAHVGRLADPAYRHRAYVDGPVAVADARVGADWRTLLVAGFGAGAQGVFALDVTDPGAVDAGAALWEFTDEDDADIGNVVGMPLILPFRGGSRERPSPRHAVVVSGGLNGYRDDGARRHNPDAPGALFLLAPDKPRDAPWRHGENYLKVLTPPGEPGMPNGLGPPGVVVEGDGTVRRLYAGDLQGNLWRIDVQAPASTEARRLPRLSAPQLLFVARDASGLRQPITVAPRTAHAPGGGILVLFGTGRLFDADDLARTQRGAQTFYAILDTPDATRVGGRAELAPRKVTISADGRVVIAGDDYTPGDASGRRGWYLDFPDSAATGERSLSAARVAHGRVHVGTLLPGRDACTAAGARQYTLDVLTGLPADGMPAAVTVVGAVAGTPIVFETAPASAGPRDATGRRMVRRQIALAGVGIDGKPLPPGPAGAVTVPAGRFGWREIANWKELRDAAARQP